MDDLCGYLVSSLVLSRLLYRVTGRRWIGREVRALGMVDGWI